MLVPTGSQARVTLAVVALGTPQRLRDCLAALSQHHSKHDFSIVCVVNAASGDAELAHELDFPKHVLPLRLNINFGWPAGLHVARASATTEYFVWVQEDMIVLEGWLDALIDAADEHSEFVAFGSHCVDATGASAGISAGRSVPTHDVSQWNLTDRTTVTPPAGIAEYDWVTAKGLLTRTAVWDEIGGANPALYPLNHVDKDYCTHLRAHGYRVALVAGAKLTHLQGQSSPPMFRRFISEYRDPRFNANWGEALANLEVGAENAEHECKPWFPGTTQRDDPLRQLEHIVAIEASTMLIAFAQWAPHFVELSLEHQRNVDAHEASATINGSFDRNERAAPPRLIRLLRSFWQR